jgi:hypothetical protein
MSAPHLSHGSVHIVASDAAGHPLLEQDLSAKEYRDRSHPLLDDPAYRKARGIVRLSGTITNPRGQIMEQFEVRFDASGLCTSDAARLADGSTIGNWEALHS